jgi:hypothetical protein
VFNVDLGPARDQWGRPLIDQPDGSTLAYTRASTMAKMLSDTTGLTKWKVRMAALGVSTRSDLRAALAAEWTRRDSKTIDDLVERAMEHAGATSGSTTGSAIHDLSEQLDLRGPEAIAHLDPDLAADLEAYRRATEHFTVYATEGFVVNDELKVAGSYDRIVRAIDPFGEEGLFVSDLKTGQYAAKQPHDICIQTAIYAHGTHYEVGTGRADRLEDLGVRQDLSLLYHLPAGGAKCDVYWLDIRNGWAMAKVAAAVRDWHQTKPIKPWSAQARLV